MYSTYVLAPSFIYDTPLPLNRLVSNYTYYSRDF